ncbi:glycosyltransferase family 4 protein [Brachyspira pilosicoli]|uniref:glycosyltransferase family 4 protein n=1 Tax=Brachyspira pilosicoli TaxID=52584 RepID=UPI002665F53C|nr:glycosyltransferase family 1 protein [Brachyspira pilosicoli]
MNIIFDCRIYETSLFRGIGRYVYSLIDHILKNFPELNISILKVNENQIPQFNYRNNSVIYYFYNKLDTYNFKEKFDFYFFDDILVTNDNKLNRSVMFFDKLFPEKLLKNSKKIVSIVHDVVPLVLRDEYVHYGNKYILQLETVYILDHMFSNSEYTKNDFIKYLNIDENNITNIYGGIDTKFNNLNIDTYNFYKRKNNIVFTSAYDDPRKNALKLVKGFAIAYNNNRIPKDSKLYLCGKVSKEYDKIVEEEMTNNNITKKNVIVTGFISDDELIELISISKATILPSLYEGLGLTILESYACNTPAFSSNVSATKELILNECSFDPYNEEDIANAIALALTNEEICNKSIKFGKRLLQEKCNWDIASKKVVSKLYELMEYIDIDNGLFTNDVYYANLYKNSHIFTTLNTAYDIRSLNNSIDIKKNNNTIIPIEYYNKFKCKYDYKNKVFIFDDAEFNIKIIDIILSENIHQNCYLFLSNKNILQTIFLYFNNNLSDFKYCIKKYYPDNYSLIEKITNEKIIFNVLQKNYIYGFSILLDILKIRNLIIYNDDIKEFILKDLKLGIVNDNLNIINNLN